MKRNPLMLASVGGAAAVLAAAGVFLGVTAADSDRTQQTTLTAATSAPTTAGVPDDDASSAAPAVPATPSDPTVTGTPVAPQSPATPTEGATSGSQDAVSAERAGELALAKAGGGRITEIDRDREDGRPVWEVEIVNGDVEHEIEIDRETGAVLKAEQEPVDDDDDDRDDDDDDDRDDD
ncbi:PepSY domain-containing protein [Micromonospora fiedleri]|uniref:PepSY domain-containing protein n=1 Tax=Micromonospora fiedleri TaxID=1157498 RepID=A0ABS1UFP0_9ACTN|nr:PepSY domain-containing protein [Micromonospora fiedleri]MBL6275150.1 PepSY domain-containing protein [Micromonospora fiedleri]